jgi:hypothetical protein
MRVEGGGYRRDHLRALAQRVEVDTGEVRIMGSKTTLLRTLAAGASGTVSGAVPSFVPNWRRGWDSKISSLVLIYRRFLVTSFSSAPRNAPRTFGCKLTIMDHLMMS